MLSQSRPLQLHDPESQAWLISTHVGLWHCSTSVFLPFLISELLARCWQLMYLLTSWDHGLCIGRHLNFLLDRTPEANSLLLACGPKTHPSCRDPSRAHRWQHALLAAQTLTSIASEAQPPETPAWAARKKTDCSLPALYLSFVLPISRLTVQKSLSLPPLQAPFRVSRVLRRAFARTCKVCHQSHHILETSVWTASSQPIQAEEGKIRQAIAVDVWNAPTARAFRRTPGIAKPTSSTAQSSGVQAQSQIGGAGTEGCARCDAGAFGFGCSAVQARMLLHEEEMERQQEHAESAGAWSVGLAERCMVFDTSSRHLPLQLRRSWSGSASAAGAPTWAASH